ncbi:hypothetical protein HYPGJ_20601 [Hyphomicrobium sp. GJ21]|nr:hypothetical protein HYPGJ_20601 [Hyphomicrobium sp. GJ21]
MKKSWATSQFTPDAPFCAVLPRKKKAAKKTSRGTRIVEGAFALRRWYGTGMLWVSQA